ncbi:unnamed protein product [Leptidea sinapis]|uniref:Generative cell specific-1/HAP2 domain-containing protein n=1 Tax=Leptidea sinapis TaxID=189913 RepID=A0A5E4QEK5_9NEOP|nr:unnamed protein product [Leptidea sinapis]
MILSSSGRLTTVVSDTRNAGSTISLQVTNTGLAAAQFRTITRECTPPLGGGQYTEFGSEKVLIPPAHTRTVLLNLPLQEFFEDAICSREDPQLLCRNMDEPQLKAAGLSLNEGFRLVRDVCYPDDVTINIFVVCLGVIMGLLLLGLVKAFLGLFCMCIGTQGLHLLLQMPRKLDHYYEAGLRKYTVEYDKDGWPIHPETKKRGVRLVSKPMEFVLNIIFFVSVPCIVLLNSFRQIKEKCRSVEKNMSSQRRNNKKCFSSQDIQNKKLRWRKQQSRLRRWMTPEAELLSTDIWQRGLSPTGQKMEPLLNETQFSAKYDEKRTIPDSEQDDAEYVLTQIQRSKESLAKCQNRVKATNSSTKDSRWAK